MKLLSTRLIEGNSVKVVADSYSKSGEAGETVVYPVWITNCESKSQTVSFSIPKYGWEAFPVTVEPAQIELAPGEKRKVELQVVVPPGIPAGGREKAGTTDFTFCQSCCCADINVYHFAQYATSVYNPYDGRMGKKFARKRKKI